MIAHSKIANNFQDNYHQKIVLKNYTVKDAVNAISDIAIKSMNHPLVILFCTNAEKSINKEKSIFDQAYNYILYKPDNTQDQQLRTLDNIVRNRVGNCTTYSTIISACLSRLGIKHSFVCASYDFQDPTNYEHIYIETDTGIILDCVQGQKQNGLDSFENRSKFGFFNRELPYIKKKSFQCLT